MTFSSFVALSKKKEVFILSKKLIMLYILLAGFIGLGVFSLMQHWNNEETDSNEEEPYEFESMQEQIQENNNGEGHETLIYDAEALRAINPDFIGWLEIPDTTISFPIVQGTDNRFYLKHGFDRSKSVYGCPFLDVRTPPDGNNLVIHGHNMGNNRTEIFSTLLLYQDQAYAEAHKKALFSITDSGESENYEVFAVVNVDVTGDFDYTVSTFESEQSRLDYLSYLQEKSLYETSFVPSGRLLILSTCNRTYGRNNRLLICLGQV